MAVAVRDFSSDGIPDLAVAYDGLANDAVTVFLGKGDGTFNSGRTYQLKGYVPESAAVGDFNHDGIPDLALADRSGVSILLGNGNGTFKAAQFYVAGAYPNSLVVGDFNGDGFPDLAVANNSSSVTILLNDGVWPP